ncbi:MAG: flavodoxin [Lachnospiraceae bacterium]|nr:flavodoxin [Lachnospiraceae bacterium]
MSTLVAYFSVGGTTAKVAKDLVEKTGSDVFEIVPVTPYTKADITFVNPVSRCNREQIGGKDVPVAGRIEDFDKYDTVYLGFPIWYGQAPRVIHTFVKDYDWTGKRVHLFATSGGSQMGKTAEKLSTSMKGAESVDGKRVTSASEID